jgi:hypothetical protein
MRTPPLLVVPLLLFGCADTHLSEVGPDARVDSPGSALWPDVFVGEARGLPDGFELGKAKVFAHTEGDLFAVDPETFAITPVAPFSWPAGTDTPKMTDIALDKQGRMIGVSKTTVYSVDPLTAKCTRLSALSSTQYSFVGLSFVVDTTSVDKREYLMALAKDGAIYEIDPATGDTKARGSLGGGLQGGGDVVSVKGFATVATVTPPGSTTDWLAMVDPGNGKATLVGDTGYGKVWGLGYWKGRVYGFATTGEFLLIDVATGKATLKAANSQIWWGAGVTTEAPVID